MQNIIDGFVIFIYILTDAFKAITGHFYNFDKSDLIYVIFKITLTYINLSDAFIQNV